jgi:8-oxo-dGTP pyrophosphatase MutT (NUDIX family)
MRLPWRIAGVDVGSVASDLFDGLSLSQAWHRSRDGGWSLEVPQQQADLELRTLAETLAMHGRCGAWRDELITVWACGPERHRQRVATIERAAARVLGLDTQAVHLIGQTTDGLVWVQQRSWSKPTHPGLWDTLVGGLVADSESLEQTLTRECWEEAGVDLGDMLDWRWVGHVDSSHAMPDADGRGYLLERLHVAVGTLAPGQEPRNQDGEVAGFACLTVDLLTEWLSQGRFAPDAAVLLLDYVERSAPSLSGLKLPASPPRH